VKKKRKLYQASLRFWLRTKWQLQQCTGNQDVNIIGRSGTREVGLLLVSHRTSNLASLRPPGGSSEMPEAGVCALMQSTHCSIWFLRAEAGFPLGLIEHQQWRKSVRTELRQVGSAPTWNTGGPGTNVQLESVRESQQRRVSSASMAPQYGWEQRRMSNLTSRRHEKRAKCTSRKRYAAKGAVEPSPREYKR
jgi:hypothetical protein